MGRVSLPLRWTMLLLLGAMTHGVPAADGNGSQPNGILVTFVNEARSSFRAGGAPGKQYRHRSRYAVASGVRRMAAELAQEFGMTLVQEWPIRALDVYCALYRVPDGGNRETLLAELAQDPRVESAQALNEFRTLTMANVAYNDPLVGLQHGLAQLHVPQAHRYARGRGIVVAIVDTGVDTRHEDLSGRILKVADFAPDASNYESNVQHGTAVAGVIAATDNNATGIVGIAPAVQLLIVRACWSQDSQTAAVCNSFTLAKALDYVSRIAPSIVNLSLAGPPDPLLARLIDELLARGIVVVAAAPPERALSFPATQAGVLAIGSAASAEGVAAGGTGPRPVLFAPGQQILTAVPGNAYDFRSGSSLAAAHATGVVALLLELRPQLSRQEISQALLQSQQSPGPEPAMIDACLALAAFTPHPDCSQDSDSVPAPASQREP